MIRIIQFVFHLSLVCDDRVPILLKIQQQQHVFLNGAAQLIHEKRFNKMKYLLN